MHRLFLGECFTERLELTITPEPKKGTLLGEKCSELQYFPNKGDSRRRACSFGRIPGYECFEPESTQNRKARAAKGCSSPFAVLRLMRDCCVLGLEALPRATQAGIRRRAIGIGFRGPVKDCPGTTRSLGQPGVAVRADGGSRPAGTLVDWNSSVLFGANLVLRSIGGVKREPSWS